MYKTLDKEQFISLIKGIDENLASIKLSDIEIDKGNKEITYKFICEKTVNEELKGKILKVCHDLSPSVFSCINVSVKKIVSNSQLISVEILKFITENFPSVSIFLKSTDVVILEVGDIVKYALRLTKDNAEYAEKGGIFKKINEHLSKNFCSQFTGSVIYKTQEETVDLSQEEVFLGEIQRVEYRTIKVSDMVVIDDSTMNPVALYIEDAKSGSVTVCGKVTEIAERQTKTGKPFFIIRLDDTTDRISGVYFSKKSTVNKIRDIKEGDAIICTGTVGEYNGKPSFTYERINRCTFPSDFVKKDKFKKSAPSEYTLVFPEPASTVSVSTVFDGADFTPSDMVDKTFVVFDLETTGLEVMENGITEIGAVKIVNGKFTEQFTTLISPDYPILPENSALTGITPEMVKDKPKISQVLPDFMKFISGATLVGQNVDFDMKFLRRFAGSEDYAVNNETLDTMILSRKYVPNLKSNNLHTLAEYFDIVFHHHRALSDAYATAEIFIKLMKIKDKREKEGK